MVSASQAGCSPGLGSTAGGSGFDAEGSLAGGVTSVIPFVPLFGLAVGLLVVLLALWQVRWYRLDTAPERPAAFSARTGLMLALTMFVEMSSL